MNIMFQQFENDINTLLTSGVRNMTGVAQEIMNTAGTIKAQESKIKYLMKTKKSLKKQIGELQKKLKQAQHKVNTYRKKLAHLEDKDISTEGRDVEDKQEELLVLSHNSEDLPVLSDNSVEDIDSEEESVNNTPSPIDPSYEILSAVDDKSERFFETISPLEDPRKSQKSESEQESDTSSDTETELNLFGQKMTYAIEEVTRLQEQIIELKILHRDQCLGLKTENSNLTIELETYRLSSNNLEEEIEELNKTKNTQIYEIQNLTINYNFWKRNFYLQLLLMAFYFYLTNVIHFHSKD